ncbi:MAG: M1 family metallopeptidase [Cyclobacteriaceae bacterium]
MIKQTIIFIFFFSIVFGCSEKRADYTSERVMAIDPHSYARPEEVIVRHIELNLTVDFEKQSLYGLARVHFDVLKPGAPLTLDVGKGLQIEAVKNDDAMEANYTIGHEDPIKGRYLQIELDNEAQFVEVHYTTSADASALQWLEPAQTAGKQKPFLFTQSQAILARTWIPLQDSPGIRFTYSARIHVPEGMMALMSAANPMEVQSDGQYTFEMDQPIPAYLMALAVGDLAFEAIGDRTGVYAEPSMLEKAVFEFAETEKMLEIAESLYGPYLWDRYDILLLPPSFPFGGMENPRLTFATPTILAGDRSLTSLIAHELAHSWSGNLVTNATWNDFWLNEGFTVYFEYRIMEKLYGADYAEMLATISYEDLQEELENLAATNRMELSSLKANLDNVNPDDGVSPIAYDKGYFFLRRLEELTGRDAFDEFLMKYFDTHEFDVMDTEYFLSYLKSELLEPQSVNLSDEQLQDWIYGTGLPADMPQVKSARFEKVDTEVNKFMKGMNAGELNTNQWSTHEWLFFLRMLPKDLAMEQMQDLDNTFNFTASKNAEIFAVWALYIIRNEYQPGFNALESFLIETGRRKFLMPLYKEMLLYPEMATYALEIYQKARSNYHFVAQNSLDELLIQPG